MPTKAFLHKKSLLDQFKDDYKSTGYIQSARAEHTWSNPITRRKRTNKLNGWIKSFQGKRHVHKLARFNAMQNENLEEAMSLKGFLSNISDKLVNKYGLDKNKVQNYLGSHTQEMQELLDDKDMSLKEKAEFVRDEIGGKDEAKKSEFYMDGDDSEDYYYCHRCGRVTPSYELDAHGGFCSDCDARWTAEHENESKDTDEKLGYEKGHKNSRGEDAPWVIRSHEDNRILASFAKKKDAEDHLKRMKQYSKQEAYVDNSATAKKDYVERVISAVQDYYGYSLFNAKNLVQSNYKKVLSWFESGNVDAVEAARCLGGKCEPTKKSEADGNKDVFTIDLFRIYDDGEEDRIDDMQASQIIYDEDEAIKVANELADSYADDDGVVFAVVMAGEREKPNGDIVGEPFDIHWASSGNPEKTAEYRKKAGYAAFDNAMDYYAKKTESSDDDLRNRMKKIGYDLLENGNLHSWEYDFIKECLDFSEFKKLEQYLIRKGWYNSPTESKKSEGIRLELEDTIQVPEWLWKAYMLDDTTDLEEDEIEKLNDFKEKYKDYHLDDKSEDPYFSSRNDFDELGGNVYDVDAYKMSDKPTEKKSESKNEALKDFPDGTNYKFTFGFHSPKTANIAKNAAEKNGYVALSDKDNNVSIWTKDPQDAIRFADTTVNLANEDERTKLERSDVDKAFAIAIKNKDYSENKETIDNATAEYAVVVHPFESFDGFSVMGELTDVVDFLETIK